MHPSAPKSALKLEFVDPRTLSASALDELFAVANGSVEIDRALFERRLKKSDWAIVVRGSRSGAAHGFVTLDVIDVEHEGVPIRLLYTGEVVFDEVAQGRQLVQRAGVASYLRFGLATRRRIYWFTDVDSYRAYLLMVKFDTGWPRRAVEPPAFEAGLYARVATQVFGASWNARTGTCEPIVGRRLKRAAAEASDELQRRNANVAFFVGRNPGYLDGAGLPMLVPLNAKNIWSVAVRTLRDILSPEHRVEPRTTAVLRAGQVQLPRGALRD